MIVAVVPWAHTIRLTRLCSVKNVHVTHTAAGDVRPAHISGVGRAERADARQRGLASQAFQVASALPAVNSSP